MYRIAVWGHRKLRPHPLESLSIVYELHDFAAYAHELHAKPLTSSPQQNKPFTSILPLPFSPPPFLLLLPLPTLPSFLVLPSQSSFPLTRDALRSQLHSLGNHSRFNWHFALSRVTFGENLDTLFHCAAIPLSTP